MNIRDSIHSNSDFILEDNIYCQKSAGDFLTFENSYLDTRRAEGRVYSDDVLKRLPSASWFHPLKREWSVRERTVKMLVAHLKSIPHKMILELGCGNGWLSNQLASSLQTDVLGLDVNKTELHQGARVFRSIQNLTFACGDIFSVNLGELKFDQIILASSVQYFADINSLVNRLLSFLNPHGEIQIIDTPFYADEELSKAQARTQEYYRSKGSPEMNKFYHHHTLREFDSYNPSIIKYSASAFYRWREIMGREGRSFHWIRIKRRALLN